MVAGALSDEDLQSILSRINQLIQDLHEDPRSFPLNITLGRAYARLAEHYLSTGQTGQAWPAVRQAAGVRDALVAGDSKSPVVLNFKRRVDALEDTSLTQGRKNAKKAIKATSDRVRRAGSEGNAAACSIRSTKSARRCIRG